MFLSNVFEGEEFNTSFNDGATEHMTMYRRDCLQVLKDQLRVFYEAKHSFPVNLQVITNKRKFISNRVDTLRILSRHM